MTLDPNVVLAALSVALFVGLIGFFAFLWTTSRDNIEGAFESPIGITAIVIGVVLECIAFLWIRSLLEVA